jgi:hypothetical protein
MECNARPAGVEKEERARQARRESGERRGDSVQGCETTGREKRIRGETVELNQQETDRKGQEINT